MNAASARRVSSPGIPIHPAMLLALGVLVAAAAGCGTRQLSAPPAEPDPMDRADYTLGVTDEIKITVWRNPELSVQIPVRPDGKISIPLLDDIQAEGLTPTELKEVLTREFAEYITAPNVTVIVVQMNSRYISIVGAVNREGRYPLSRNLRVLEALASAGGFDTFADKDNVRIVRRQSDGSETEYRFDYDAYIKGKAPGTNIVLVPGDTIIVPD